MTSASSEPVIALVVAVGENGVIGHGGDLPWRLSSDLKMFRSLTMGKPLIMGRKTFQSIGRPLDGRDNIVVTRDESFGLPGVDVVASFDAAVEAGRRFAKRRGVSEIMVIGGAEIYRQALPEAGRVYWTIVHACPEGDVRLEPLDPEMWTETARRGPVQGERDQYACSFVVYERREKSS